MMSSPRTFSLCALCRCVRSCVGTRVPPRTWRLAEREVVAGLEGLLATNPQRTRRRRSVSSMSKRPEVADGARHGLNPAVDMIQAVERRDRHVCALTAEPVDGHHRVLEKDFFVISTVIHEDRRLRPPPVHRVLTQSHAQAIVRFVPYA